MIPRTRFKLLPIHSQLSQNSTTSVYLDKERYSVPVDCTLPGCLKCRLIEAPVLPYPNFTKDFTLETDAIIMVLRSVLSQVQDDGKRHPIAFACPFCLCK